MVLLLGIKKYSITNFCQNKDEKNKFREKLLSSARKLLQVASSEEPLEVIGIKLDLLGNQRVRLSVEF